MSERTPQFDIATVGELEKLIKRLKRQGLITAATPLSAIDVDGSTRGEGPCQVHVFNPNALGHGRHTLAIWGPYGIERCS